MTQLSSQALQGTMTSNPPDLPTGPAPAADDEPSLVDAAVQGDQAAFAALYDRHLARVYRYCYYRTGDRADAEDLAQQTFLHAWQAIGRYRRGSTPFVAWLLTISQRLAIAHYRKARLLVTAELPAVTAGDSSDPAALALSSIAHDAVRAAILRLKPDRQQVVLLRFIEGFSVAEVAAALGKTENHVRVIQHRALADLRSLLQEPAATVPAGRGTAGTLRAAVATIARRLTPISRR